MGQEGADGYYSFIVLAGSVDVSLLVAGGGGAVRAGGALVGGDRRGSSGAGFSVTAPALTSTARFRTAWKPRVPAPRISRTAWLVPAAATVPPASRKRRSSVARAASGAAGGWLYGRRPGRRRHIIRCAGRHGSGAYNRRPARQRRGQSGMSCLLRRKHADRHPRRLRGRGDLGGWRPSSLCPPAARRGGPMDRQPASHLRPRGCARPASESPRSGQASRSATCSSRPTMPSTLRGCSFRCGCW